MIFPYEWGYRLDMEGFLGRSVGEARIPETPELLFVSGVDLCSNLTEEMDGFGRGYSSLDSCD